MVAAAEACARYYGVDVPKVLGGELNPYIRSLEVISGEAMCDRVHRAVWATSVYDVTLEEAFKKVFPS